MLNAYYSSPILLDARKLKRLKIFLALIYILESEKKNLNDFRSNFHSDNNSSFTSLYKSKTLSLLKKYFSVEKEIIDNISFIMQSIEIIINYFNNIPVTQKSEEFPAFIVDFRMHLNMVRDELQNLWKSDSLRIFHVSESFPDIERSFVNDESSFASSDPTNGNLPRDTTIFDLPPEMLGYLSSFLGFRDFLSYASTNKELYFIRTPALLKNYILFSSTLKTLYEITRQNKFPQSLFFTGSLQNLTDSNAILFLEELFIKRFILNELNEQDEYSLVQFRDERDKFATLYPILKTQITHDMRLNSLTKFMMMWKYRNLFEDFVSLSLNESQRGGKRVGSVLIGENIGTYHFQGMPRIIRHLFSSLYFFPTIVTTGISIVALPFMFMIPLVAKLATPTSLDAICNNNVDRGSFPICYLPSSDNFSCSQDTQQWQSQLDSLVDFEKVAFCAYVFCYFINMHSISTLSRLFTNAALSIPYRLQLTQHLSNDTIKLPLHHLFKNAHRYFDLINLLSIPFLWPKLIELASSASFPKPNLNPLIETFSCNNITGLYINPKNYYEDLYQHSFIEPLVCLPIFFVFIFQLFSIYKMIELSLIKSYESEIVPSVYYAIKHPIKTSSNVASLFSSACTAAVNAVTIRTQSSATNASNALDALGLFPRSRDKDSGNEIERSLLRRNSETPRYGI